MNWSVIILGLVALSSVAIAENSYLVIVPKLLKVGHDNQLSVFIAASSQAVDVKFELTIGQNRVQGTTSVKPGETRNATLALPREFPVGAGELHIVGTGGVRFEEKRDVIVYDNHNVILVQTSASNYQPGDVLKVRLVATNEELFPLEKAVALVEIYDANLKLVGQFENVAIRSGLTETLEFPLARQCSFGTWLVSATIGNTTSSLEVTVAAPVTPSFDLKAIFQRFLLRTDKNLRGIIEIDNDENEAIFGRAIIAVNQITEESMQIMMKQRDEQRRSQSEEQPKPVEEWRQWKQQQFEIAGRVEINYDLASLFNVDVSKALAVQVYIQVVDLASGQERFIQHVIPIFTRDVIYDIRPLEFEAGIKNEFEIIAKRPDGKPSKMEDLIVTVTMILGNEQGKVQEEKSVEIKDFYTRGRNDIAFFNIEIPQNCIGVLMTIAPLSEDGKVRGYRTHAMPLMPTPRRGVSGGKLSIELLPTPSSSVQTEVNAPVVSSHISTVGRTSNFYVQVLPSKPVEKFEPLPMSYMVLTNGRITLTGEFSLQPTKECRSRSQRAIKPEEQKPPTCVFNATLPIQITRAMLPYSTLLVYTFQPSFGFNVAESYKFAVAGLFQHQLTLNATIVPYTSANSLPEDEDSREEYESQHLTDSKPISISHRAQGKSRVELSFTGTPDSTVGLNVFEYDAITQGLTNEITRERVLQYLTAYEQVPIVGMPTLPQTGEDSNARHVRDEKPEGDLGKWHEHGKDVPMPSESDDDKLTTLGKKPLNNQFQQRAVLSEEEEQKHIAQAQSGFKIRYPVERMIFGVGSSRGSHQVEGDDPYTTPNLGHLYGDVRGQRSQTLFRRRGGKQSGQFDVSVSDNDYVVATSFPVILKTAMYQKPGQQQQQQHQHQHQQQEQQTGKQQSNQEEAELDQQDGTQESRDSRPQYGSSSWYEKMNSKLSAISQEAFTFMQSGLSVVTDFPSLRVPHEMRRTNLTKIFSRLRTQSKLFDSESFTRRDEARQLLEEYISEGDLSMLPPPIVLEEQARVGYYRSLYFNTSRIEAQGTGKVVLPRTKPYSTWLATGFALNAKSGLTIAQPIRLPTNQGLYIMGNLPDQMQIGEQVLLPYGINNYLGKDLSNVIVRIRASADFDLIEQNQPERIVSSNGKDYTMTIPALKSLGVETRNIVLVPKRAGVIKVVLEVECEFGGDYEVLTSFVRESGIPRRQLSGRLIDLTSDKKTYGPIVEKVTQSPFLRSVKLVVSGTNLERLIQKDTKRTNSLVGIDQSVVRLWRLLGLRWYLNQTSQVDSKLDSIAEGNLTLALQQLQSYAEYDGSYSLVSAQGEQEASLYLTTLALGAMLSPFMPIHDNVTINRSLTWVLSRQQQDGSFEDQTACYHYRVCGGEFRREALTAVVYYALTRNNISEMVPEFVRRPLYQGEQSPMLRAQRYLESRLDAVKSSLFTTTLMELALVGSRSTSEQLKQRIFQNVRARQLTVVPEDSSRYLKNVDEKMTMDDQILINSMTLSIYQLNGDLKTVLDMARWIVKQRDVHPFYDTVLDLVLRTEAWIRTGLLFRQRNSADQISVIVDVTADNGQKQQFKINAANMDFSQKLNFTLPVNKITYTVSGFGLVDVCLKQMYMEKQPQEPKEPVSFQMTQELSPLPWLNEIAAKSCLTYTPTAQDQQLAKDTFNRTVVVEVQIPSGFRLNLRQIGFFLSRVPEALHFTHDDVANKISFFLNIPSTSNGKQICLQWCLERLSFVSQWAPIQIRAYDYLRPESQFVRLLPIQIQPNLLGYSFVDAVHKSRPTIEQVAKIQQQPSTHA